MDDIEEDWAKEQVRISTFGTDWKNHSFEDAVGIHMCDDTGHPYVEKLLAAPNMAQEAEYLELQYESVGNTIEVFCRRCKRWFQV